MKKIKVTTDDLLNYILGFKNDFDLEKLELVSKHYEREIGSIDDSLFISEVERYGGYKKVLTFLKLQKTLACIFNTSFVNVYLKVIDLYKDEYFSEYINLENKKIKTNFIEKRNA